MSLYAAETRWTGRAVFARETREHRQLSLVEAENVDDALRQVRSAMSVLSLEHGVTISLRPVGDVMGEWFARYDGEPLTESHMPTGAELVTVRTL